MSVRRRLPCSPCLTGFELPSYLNGQDIILPLYLDNPLHINTRITSEQQQTPTTLPYRTTTFPIFQHLLFYSSSTLVLPCKTLLRPSLHLSTTDDTTLSATSIGYIPQDLAIFPSSLSSHSATDFWIAPGPHVLSNLVFLALSSTPPFS